MKTAKFRLPARGVSALAVLSALLFLIPFPTLLAAPPPSAPRVVAIGDVHCDFDAFTALLQHNGLIDSKLQWIGVNATLVQTGDILDRGTKCREVMDLLMSLEKQAPKKRGRVVVLLGNHEMMNIMGDLRYAAPMFAGFADAQSESRRRKALEQHRAWIRDRYRAWGEPEPAFLPQMEEEWFKGHPLGYFEQRQAFSPSGKYGRWLRERPAVFRLDSTIFVHGGISPQLASFSPEQIAERVRSEIAAFDSLTRFFIEQKIILPFFNLDETIAAVRQELEFRQRVIAQKRAAAQQAGSSYEPSDSDKKFLQLLEQFLGISSWFSVHQAGPLWCRDYDRWTEEEGTAHVSQYLAAHSASRIVVGHTPQKDGRIRHRFGGRVFLIDTGMLTSHYTGGRPSALEIAADKLSAIYMDDRIVLLDSAAAPPVSAPPVRQMPDETPGGGLPESSLRSAPQSAPASPQVSQPAAPSAAPARVWLGADGSPLPFKSDAEVLEFLRTAKIVRVRDIPQGITQPRKALLEKDGIQAHAVFRNHEEERDIARMADGKVEMGFRDSYLFEAAAYELSEILGIHRVPPTVLRKYAGQSGSLQLWLENVMTETNRLRDKIPPPDPKNWNRQLQILRIFDNLIFNTDRNRGNILIDKNWRVWFIDHTRAFRRYDDLSDPRSIIQCERKLWDALRNFDEAEARRRLRPFLRNMEIDALFKRRLKLVTLIEKLIAEKGEDQVLFSLD